MKKFFVLLVMILMGIFLAGCSLEADQERTEKLQGQITQAESIVIEESWQKYKGDVVIIRIPKGLIEVETLEKISTKDLSSALKRSRVYAVGLHMRNDSEVNFINTLLLKDMDFKVATQVENDILHDYLEEKTEKPESYYWFAKEH